MKYEPTINMKSGQVCYDYATGKWRRAYREKHGGLVISGPDCDTRQEAEESLQTTEATDAMSDERWPDKATIIMGLAMIAVMLAAQWRIGKDVQHYGKLKAAYEAKCDECIQLRWKHHDWPEAEKVTP